MRPHHPSTKPATTESARRSTAFKVEKSSRTRSRTNPMKPFHWRSFPSHGKGHGEFHQSNQRYQPCDHALGKPWAKGVRIPKEDVSVSASWRGLALGAKYPRKSGQCDVALEIGQ